MNENFNIFCNVSVETVKEIRKFMISNILSTDMKEHFTILENFETRLKELSDYKLSFSIKYIINIITILTNKSEK